MGAAFGGRRMVRKGKGRCGSGGWKPPALFFPDMVFPAFIESSLPMYKLGAGQELELHF